MRALRREGGQRGWRGSLHAERRAEGSLRKPQQHTALSALYLDHLVQSSRPRVTDSIIAPLHQLAIASVILCNKQPHKTCVA